MDNTEKRRTSETTKARHGEDFYKRIGAIGGRAVTSRPKGFGANRELARIAGAKGGKISRRGKNKKGEVLNEATK